MFLANGFVMGAWAPQIPLLMPRHEVTESALGLLILVLGLGAVTAMLFAINEDAMMQHVFDLMTEDEEDQ